MVASAVFKLVLLTVGLLAMAGGWQLGLGTLQEPGPGLWPAMVAAVLAALTVFLLLNERHSEVEGLTPRSWKVAVAVATLVVFVFGLAYLGLILPTVLLLVFWFRWLGDEPWPLSLLLGTIFASAYYVLFAVLLGVPFPPDLVLGLFGANNT